MGSKKLRGDLLSSQLHESCQPNSAMSLPNVLDMQLPFASTSYIILGCTGTRPTHGTDMHAVLQILLVGGNTNFAEASTA